MQSPHGPRTPRITAATRLVSSTPRRHAHTYTAAGPQSEGWYRGIKGNKDRSGCTNTVEGEKRGSLDAPLVTRERCVAPFAWAACLWMATQQSRPQTQWTKRKNTHKKKVEKTNKHTNRTNQTSEKNEIHWMDRVFFHVVFLWFFCGFFVVFFFQKSRAGARR